jgi:hypothetical protein
MIRLISAFIGSRGAIAFITLAVILLLLRYRAQRD